MKIEAFQVAEDLNLKKFKVEYSSEPLFSTNSELFYKRENQQYIYLFSYGTVVFVNINDLEKSSFLKYLKEYSENAVQGKYQENFDLLIDPNTPLFLTYDSITVSELTDDAVQIIALNIAQSVALDFYEALVVEIFYNSKKLTDELEENGVLKTSKKDLLKFIGRTLNIKNNIIDNLYIFDAPDIVWENEHLEKIDRGLKKTFELKVRYQEINHKIRIIQENLTMFTDLLQNRENTRLEWIIIILILIEVFDLLINKFVFRK